MHTRLTILLAVLLTEAPWRCGLAQPAPRLDLDRRSSGLEISWPGSLTKPDGSVERPFFELQRSTDLRAWQPFGERLRASITAPGQTLSVTPSDAEAAGFFRLLQIEARPAAGLGQGGAEVFGYNDAFNQELRRIGQIAPEQFAAMFPHSAQYLPGISWNPTAATYWDQFAANPDEANHGLELGQPGWRSKDYRLFMIAAVTQDLGEHEEAEKLFQTGIREYSLSLGTNHPMVGFFHKGYGVLLAYHLGQVPEAISNFEAAVAIQRGTVGPDNQSTLETETYLARALALQGRTNDAVTRGSGLRSRWAQYLPSDHARLKIRELGEFFVQYREFDEARLAFEQRHGNRGDGAGF
jgi:hypothetical protein